MHNELALKQLTQARVENVSFYDLDLDFTVPRKPSGGRPCRFGVKLRDLFLRLLVMWIFLDTFICRRAAPVNPPFNLNEGSD